VATAVTQGDLTRQVGVEANGEVAELKDKLNEMIRNLRETTRQNTEQDWLKTNLERFTRMLQGQRDLATVSNLILSELAPLVSAQHAIFYSMTSPTDGSEPLLKFQAGYGYEERKHLLTTFQVGQGLVGQCAQEKQRILLTNVPSDYVKINSGLGDSTPLNIIVLPILFEGSVRAIRRSSINSPRASAWFSTRSQPTRSPRTYSSSPNRRPRSSSPNRRSCARPTRISKDRPSFSPNKTLRQDRRTERLLFLCSEVIAGVKHPGASHGFVCDFRQVLSKNVILSRATGSSSA
jgi:hypothetical protein